MRRSRIFVILVVIISTLLIHPGFSSGNDFFLNDQEAGGGPVNIQADELEFNHRDRTYTLRGNVEIVRDDKVIRADMITVNHETKDIEAVGNIILIHGQDVLKSQRMDLNLDAETGVVDDGTLFFEEDNFHMSGKRIEKLGKDTYRIIDGSFTTCDDPSPPWKFTAKEINVTLEGYAKVKHATFHLKDIPVLYFPYFIYPAKTKRQTGFLIPSAGYSSSEGGQVFLPFFWAIGEHNDATFSLDYRSERGVGEDVEYRHVFAKDSSLNLHLYHMDEKESYQEWREKRRDDETVSDPDRWLLEGRYEHSFDPSFAAKVDFTHISDRDFYRDFGETTDERSKEKEESTAFISKVWEGFSLNSELRYTEDLTEDDDTTLQRLPRVEFVGSKRNIFNIPLFYGVTSAVDSFWREEGPTGKRVDIYPEMLYAFHKDYFSFEPKIGVRETAYYQGDDLVDTREIYDFHLGLFTTFQRIFHMDGENLQKLKHSISPEIEYTYIPEVKQEDLPEFDSLDRIDENSSITYSLTNEFIGKLNGAKNSTYYRKFARLKLSQTYDFIEAHRSLESSSDSRRPFSPISGELDLYPNSFLSLGLDGEYDTHEGSFTTYNVLMGLQDKRGDSLGLEYRFTEEVLEEIHTNLAVKMTDFLDFKMQNIYSKMESKSLETIFALEYRSQCWGVRITYSDLFIEEEERREQEYMVTFILTGIGEFGW